MKNHVHLSDVFHWQLKRCVNGSPCETCSEADTASEVTVIETSNLYNDNSRPQTAADCRPLTYIAGVDISFVKDDDVNACAACVVVKLPDFAVRCFALL